MERPNSDAAFSIFASPLIHLWAERAHFGEKEVQQGKDAFSFLGYLRFQN
jgi:hypothetical protein